MGMKPLRRTSQVLALVALFAPVDARGQEAVNLPAQDKALRPSVQEVFSVGSMAGEEWETFARVRTVAFDGKGNLYILDADNGRVVKVGPDGRFLGELGRKGEGPGEFQMPLGMAVTQEGEVAVFDVGHTGFTLFRPDGSFARTVPLAGGMSSIPTGTLLPHPDGGILSGGGGGFRISAGSGEPSSGPVGRPITLFSLEDGSGKPVYEAWGPPPPGGGRPANLSSGGGGIRISAAGLGLRAFDPGLYVGVLPQGSLVVADSATYRVKVVGADGSVQRVLTRAVPPRRVSRRDQEDEKARRLAEMESSGGPRIVMRTQEGTSSMRGGDVQRMMADQIESMEFAEVVPVVAGMGVDWTGRIWLARAGRRVGEDGPIDLLTADGGYLGTLSPGETEIPDAFGPGGLAAFIERDEMDVPRVVVKRIILQ